MARPPAEQCLPFTAEDALDRLRLSGVLRPFAGWQVVEARAQGFAPAQAQLRVLVTTPAAAAAPALGAAIEVLFEVDLEAVAGCPLDATAALDGLELLRARVLALAHRAARDRVVTAFVRDNDSVVARFDEVGGPGRLVFRALGQEGASRAPIFFPDPAAA